MHDGEVFVRVLTMNLWGIRGDWRERRTLLAQRFRELQPDLVAFQEAIETEGYDQAVDLLGSDYRVAHQSEREPDGQGISIASRWPIGEVRELDLHVTPRTDDFACAALVAEIQAPEPHGTVLFVNLLPSWQLDFEVERERQAVRTARFIEDVARGRQLHVIIAGDLDADPAAASMRFWRGLQSLDGISVCYRDAWESRDGHDPGHTFTPRNPLVADHDWPFRRIDYILVRCGEHGGPTLQVSACELVLDKPVDRVWASDHFGVVADLTPPQR
jgi:endonuclease/exonuclease/phosphatase family metal-dependent hydrolase